MRDNFQISRINSSNLTGKAISTSSKGLLGESINTKPSDSFNKYKIFSGDTLTGVRNNGLSSKYKNNRDYLITDEVANELNSYRTFSPIVAFNDNFGRQFKFVGTRNGGDIYEEIFDQSTGPRSLGITSIFNKHGVVMLGIPGVNLNSAENLDITKNQNSSNGEWRISNNVPLMDSPNARIRIKKNSGCTIKELVQASRTGQLGQEVYNYSDFMYCKHLGKMPNNYMITLRRFPMPVDDFISSIGESQKGSYYTTSHDSSSIGCMVTWLGTSGNEMENILKYSYKMPFIEKNAEWQKDEVDADAGQQGPANAIAAMFDDAYRQAYIDGKAGTLVNTYVDKLLGNATKLGKLTSFMGPGTPAYRTDFDSFRDNNKVYGPVDFIKSTFQRSSEGLDFKQSFTLTFEYELRSYNGINGRQAMLDLLSNILNVTYSTGTFWGGGFYGGGAHQNNIFSNLEVFKFKNRDFQTFTDDIMTDCTNLWDRFKSSIKGKSLLNIISTVASNLGSMFIAGQLNKLGRPQKAQYASLLSEAPVGLWHVTIGNPHHPIMSIGNLILTDTSITHTGPLGLDDFPTGIKVTCELTRGKPRDIRDIEKLYMHGNDRIFYSMGPKLEELFKSAKQYKSKINKNSEYINNNETDTLLTNANIVSMDEIKTVQNVHNKFMGPINGMKYSIEAAMESEYGTYNKKEKESYVSKFN